MAKPPDVPRCLKPGCFDRVEVSPSGGFRSHCPAHTPAPLTVREQIARLPRFEQADDVAPCVACAYFPDAVDKVTGLCRECWRCHRWSSVREREFPR